MEAGNRKDYTSKDYVHVIDGPERSGKSDGGAH
jgi:hypothetical protein